MTQSEFLRELREALVNDDVEARAVQENIDYYNGYITDEVNKGRSEEEVLEELGDPWIVAKGIVDVPGNVSYTGTSGAASQYESNETGYGQEREQSSYHGRVHVAGLDTWWKKLLAVLVVVMIVFVVIALVAGFISLLAPIIIPLVIIMIIVRLVGGRK